MSNRKTTAEKIEAAKVEKQQAEALIKKLIREQRAEERKARNHRICKRGGLIESLLPDVIGLSDERFKAFLTKTAANDFGKKTLATLKAEQDKEDGIALVSKPADESDNVAEPAPPTPVQPPQSGGTASSVKTQEALRPGA